MARARWTVALLVMLTLVSVCISTAWACSESDDVVLVDGELPGGG